MAVILFKVLCSKSSIFHYIFNILTHQRRADALFRVSVNNNNVIWKHFSCKAFHILNLTAIRCTKLGTLLTLILESGYGMKTSVPCTYLVYCAKWFSKFENCSKCRIGHWLIRLLAKTVCNTALFNMHLASLAVLSSLMLQINRRGIIINYTVRIEGVCLVNDRYSAHKLANGCIVSCHLPFLGGSPVIPLLSFSCSSANAFSAILFLLFTRSSSNSPRSLQRFRRTLRWIFNWIRQQMNNFPTYPTCKIRPFSATL